MCTLMYLCPSLQVVDTCEMQNDVEPLETEIEGFAREESRLKDEIFEV